MESSSALCDALLGRRRYTDPAVHREAQILLGDDDAAAMEYIQTTRAKLIDNYLKLVEDTMELEPLVFPRILTL